MHQSELIPHLFRTEFRKITAVLCRYLGMEQLQAAEDIAGETFLLALETWAYKGVPANPSAWLYTVARNKARNLVVRTGIFTKKVSAGSVYGADSYTTPADITLSEQIIEDSQLRMLFAVCHPSLAAPSQVALALRVLCGFGIDEIANALLANRETINKRLTRAKEKLREQKIQLDFPPAAEIPVRLNAVLTTLYLLFNEGYYSESSDAVLREDLCLEAISLTKLLVDNELTNLPAVNALLALMCFHASRFRSRKDASGEMILYGDQDETLWNRELIARGAYYLHEASKGTEISRYHLEAGIAYWHTIRTDTQEKWTSILRLYNQLLQVAYSPVAALNRTYALSRANSKAEAIAEAQKLQLTGNHFYFVLLGELYKGIDDDKAKIYFQKALALAKTHGDKRSIQKNIDILDTTG